MPAKQIPHRIVIYPKDIENITGRRPKTARTMLQNIRKALGKSKDKFVTIKEFCLVTGIDEESVKEFLEH